MKLSMWMVKKHLDKYMIEYDISDCDLTLDQFRVVGGEEEIADPHKMENGVLYIWQSGDQIRLQEGTNHMIVHLELFRVINELVFLFHHFNSWEERLLTTLNTQDDLQGLLDTFEAVCPYPLVFMELDGSILAMSQSFSEDEVNEDWFRMKSSMQVPMGVDRSQYNEINKDSFVDETPQMFQNGSGDNYIAMYFTRNHIRFMGMVLFEYPIPFTPDIFQLCSFLSNVIQKQPTGTSSDQGQLRTRASILYDFLEDNPVNALDLDRFYENEAFIFPWYLVTISSSLHLSGDITSYVIDSFQKNPRIKTVVLNYNNALLAMVQQIRLPLFLKELKKLINLDYYQLGISLPFHSLQKLPLRYQQALFAQTAEPGPGVRYCKDYALDYLMHSIRQDQTALEMIHPALETLRAADERKNSQLYDTLWQYLNHDRSIHATSEAMFVHRNSLLYRLKRIRELTGIDTDDLKECEYLRVSYMIENQVHFS